MDVGLTDASTLCTTTSPMRTAARLTRKVGIKPLAVDAMPRSPAFQLMPNRSASAWPMAIMVAPVSTMKRTARPLMLPSVTKWPPAPAVMTISLPPPLLAGAPMLTGAAPTRSSVLLPSRSIRASSPRSSSSLTPRALAPTASTCVCPSITSKARWPITPESATPWACAASANMPLTMAVRQRRMFSRGSCQR